MASSLALRTKDSIGAVLDPIADKLLMTSSILILSLPQMEFLNTVPRWLMIVIISGDVFILLVSLIVVLMVGWRVFHSDDVWEGQYRHAGS